MNGGHSTMQTVELSMSDEINLGDFFIQLKSMYPSLRLVNSQTHKKAEDKFTGIDDLIPLYVPDFKMYPREELYDDR
jgi:hypothetical protein